MSYGAINFLQCRVMPARSPVDNEKPGAGSVNEDNLAWVGGTSG